MSSTKPTGKSQDLKAAWERLKSEQGVNTQRDGAAMLGVPEAVLQDACAGPNAVRLRPQYGEILKAARNLGRLMTLVRNDNFVAMPVGEFADVSIDGTKGRAHGGAVDLSFDLSRWGAAFALTDESKGAIRRSLYFFDDCGDAALKALVWSKEGDDAFNEIVERFRDVKPTDVVTTPKSPADWRSAADFAGGRSASRNAPERAVALLQAVVDNEINVDLRIPARATQERYVGPLRNLRKREDSEGWYDVNYPHFNTHLAAINVARLGVAKDAKADGATVGLIDAQDRVICHLGLAADNSPKAKAAWQTAVNAALAD